MRGVEAQGELELGLLRFVDLAVVPTSSSSRHPRLRGALLVTGGSIAGAALLSRWERSRSGAPWDATSEQYPHGEDRIVATPDGAELAVTVAGAPGGHTVVLSHCWMGSRAVWGPVARRLVDSGHRVVLYDQRGHGASSVGERTLSLPMLGDDLRAVLEATDARDAVLVGHSMGGMSVQSYVAEHPVDFKERARGVVLVATAAKVPLRPMSARAIERGMRRGASPRTSRGTLGYAVSRAAFGRSARRADVELTMHGVAHTANVARVGLMAAMSSMDLRSALGSVDVPVTVLVGTRDLLTPPRLARTLAAGIPGARLVVLPGAGHMLPFEAPDTVIEAVEAIGAIA